MVRIRNTTPSVLHVSQVTDLGGVTYCIADYTRLQVERGWRVFVACPPGLLHELAARAGAETLPWAASREPGPGVVDEVWRLSGIIRRAHPDVVHLHSSKAGLAGRLALRGSRPTVFSPHGWSWDAVQGRMREVVTRWERTAARWTHSYLCVSQDERDQGLVRGLDGSWQVLPNAVDPAVAAVADRAVARRRLGVDPDQPLAVCVGRLCRQKGQDVLLAAWPRVSTAVPGAGLVLVGDGPDRAEVERASAGRNDVRLAGAVSRTESLEWMAAADVVVLPSRWEGMALVLLEARAMARAIVATDVTGTREAMGSRGGVLVPPDAPEDLADSLVGLLRDREQAAAVGARSRAEMGTDPQREQGDRLVELYHRLIGTPNPALDPR